MKRPFLFLGIIALLTSALNFFISPIIVAVFLLVLIALFILRKNEISYKILGVLSVVVLILSLAITTVSIKESEAFVGEQEVNAKVIDIEENDNFNSVTVKIKIGSTKIKARLFDYDKGWFTKGDNLTIRANLRKPSEDELSYTYSKGIYLVGSINEITEKSSGKGIYKLGYHLTSYIEKTIKQPLDSESAAPIIAFLTGNQDSFDTESEANIKACGTSHVMVVSGLHLGIICGAMISLLNRVKANKKTVFLCGIITIFLILLVCGFHISAIRAAITYIVILAGGIIRRRADTLNSLGFAVFFYGGAKPFHCVKRKFFAFNYGNLWRYFCGTKT